jgi:nucleoside-diphosphate-sugar epimerase
MRIALVGAGEVGLRLATEFCKSEDEVVVLTSTMKPNFGHLKAEINLTDYSVDDLTKNLDDCDAVVSTLSGPSEFYISAHSNILEACHQSRRCKHFIPSEWNINIEDFPDQPMFSAATHEVVRSKLRSQNDTKWTMICHGWFMEYVLSPERNPLREIGLAWAMNHGTKVFDMYADGLQKVTLTSTADAARAVLAVLRDSISTGADLPPVTHLAGQTLTYRDLFELIRTRDPAWKSNPVTFSEVLDAIHEGLKAGDAHVAIHQMRVLGFTNANHNPKGKALEWGMGVLQGLRATSVKEFLDQAEAGENK